MGLGINQSVTSGGQIYPTLTAISPSPTLHLARFMATSFPKPTLLLSFSTSVFHVVVLASSFPSLQTPTLFSKHAHHPSSTHSRTISLHSPTVSFNPNVSIQSSFSLSVLHHTLHSPLLSQSFSKLPFYFPVHTMSYSHITSPILHNSDKPFLSS